MKLEDPEEVATRDSTEETLKDPIEETAETVNFVEGTEEVSEETMEDSIDETVSDSFEEMRDV